MPKPSSTFMLQLTGIAHGGEAFGYHQGRVVFVPYAIPGETVTVEFVEEKPKWARARLVHVQTPSPDRVAPPCPYFGPGRCGGCQWQHISYERQLRLKQEVVVDQLRRLGGIARPPVLDPIALADDEGLLDYRYRNRAQFFADHVGALGYPRAAESRDRTMGRGGLDIIPVDECLLLHPLVDELHQALKAIAPANETDDDVTAEQKPVVVRRVNLQSGLRTGQQLLVFETEQEQAPGLLVEEWPVNVALRRIDGSVQALIGDAWIEEVVADHTFRVSAGSHFPANTIGAEAMVDLAADLLGLESRQTLLDAFCGVGLFGLSLADQVGRVVGIDESESACEDFAWSAGELDNVMLFEGPVAEVLATFPGPDEQPVADAPARIDVAIITPPRNGAGPEVLAELRRLAVPRLLYVSDDPATLARDARLLMADGYKLRQVQPVDLAPQTYHAWSLALFEL